MPRETWILLRGLGREAGHWGPFLPSLEAALPDADVLTLDLPGAGAHLDEPWPGSIHLAMERVRSEVAARVRARSRLTLFGVSLGGMVVLEWAACHQGELRGVVVGASSASDASPFWKRMRPRGLAGLATSALIRDRRRRQARIVRTVSNRRDLWGETIHRWTQVVAARPVRAATVGGQIVSASTWDAPAALAVPSLFLVGRGDRLVHPDCSRALARRFGAELVEHPAAGHDLTTDASEWVVSELARFERRIGRQSRSAEFRP